MDAARQRIHAIVAAFARGEIVMVAPDHCLRHLP